MRRASIDAVLSLVLLAHAVGCGGGDATNGTGRAPASTSSISSISSTSSTGGNGGADSAGSTASTASTTSTSSAGGTSCDPVNDYNPCTDDSCEDGVPVHTPLAAGTALPTQMIGDCQKLVCDGNGVAVPQADEPTCPAT